MSSMNVNRLSSAQQPNFKSNNLKTEVLQKSPASFSRPTTDASLLGNARKLVERGLSLLTGSAASNAAQEVHAQRFIERQKWLEDMDIAVAALHAQAGKSSRTEQPKI